MKSIIKAVAIAATLTCISASPAFAQGDGTGAAPEVVTQTATEYVQGQATAISGIVNSPDMDREQRLAALRDAISSVIDFDVLAERTLGATHWDARTPEERTEFVDLLRDLVETSYSRNLGNDHVEAGGYDVAYIGERSRNERTTVEGTVTIDGDMHTIEVKLMQRPTGWIVYDIITDDVSLEESYAESFDNIIADHGWAGLLERMRERLAEFQAE